MFGQSQAGERNTSTGSRWFIHLAKDQGDTGFFQLVIIHLVQGPFPFFHFMAEGIAVPKYAGLDHFTHQIVALTGTLSNSRKDRHPIVTLGDVVD